MICQVSAVCSPNVLYFIKFSIFFLFSSSKSCDLSHQIRNFLDLCKPSSPLSPASPPSRRRRGGAPADALCPVRAGKKLLGAGRVCPAPAPQGGKNAESPANTGFFASPPCAPFPRSVKERPLRPGKGAGGEKPPQQRVAMPNYASLTF